MSSTKIK
jgi:hypothetical protein